MGYSYLLESPAALATFRNKFNIPNDVDVAYCHESDIELHRGRACFRGWIRGVCGASVRVARHRGKFFVYLLHIDFLLLPF